MKACVYSYENFSAIKTRQKQKAATPHLLYLYKKYHTSYDNQTESKQTPNGHLAID
jgi:hypothetical protein